jgi:hypothetical protein
MDEKCILKKAQQGWFGCWIDKGRKYQEVEDQPGKANWVPYWKPTQVDG